MSKKYILALDQGTSSSRAVIFDHDFSVIASEQKEFPQIYPKPGWVEHNPMEILESQIFCAKQAILKGNIAAADIEAIGITNQRETTVLWNRKTGKPIYNAIVWQDRRTADYCRELKNKGLEEKVRNKTGLVIDSYFSATKIRWILNEVEAARELAEQGDLLFGTIDSWLIWNLSGRKSHFTDASNASRSMIFNINDGNWDAELLEEFSIPKTMLPVVKDSADDFGICVSEFFGAEIPICGVAGDQQAALFGQNCFEAGTAKNTYGTGCFMLMNTGEKPIISKNGLLTTIAWSLNGKCTYALEGSVFTAGAVVRWLRDEMKFIKNAEDSEALALSVPDTDGVMMVPAFAGLGAPYWDSYARGGILGLTAGTSSAHIVRAALESIAFQSKDILLAMQQDSGIELKNLRVDGGAAMNNFLMQFQAEMLEVPVQRPMYSETTVLGAAKLAGLKSGFWKPSDFEKPSQLRNFLPGSDSTKFREMYKNWQRTVKRVLESKSTIK